MDSTGTGEQTWDDIADWYGDLVAGGSPTHETALAALLELAPDMSGAAVLDLACGQGLAARALAERGAIVTAVDLTERLLALAAESTPPELADRITWVHDDAQRLESLGHGAFDGVACNLGLMDIPDLDAVLRHVNRVLRPGGWFVFTLTHPCFLAPHATWSSSDEATASRVVHDYLREGFWRSDNPDGVRRVGSHHRTVSTYLNTLVERGFLVQRMLEPAGNDRLADLIPPYRRIPPFMAIRAHRQ